MDKIKFGALVGFMAAAMGRALSKFELEDLDSLTKVEPVKQTAYCDLGQMDIMLKAIRDSKRIEAIKAHRALTGLGLKESKDAIDLAMNISSNVSVA